MGAGLQDRAEDVMAAFADSANKAVFTSIGGTDQIRLIKYLDPEIFRRNPKPFFGYSDNTHIHNFLWRLGIPSYYGGAIMTEFAFQDAMQSITVRSLYSALFEKGELAIDSSAMFNDIGLDWSDKANLHGVRVFEVNDGLHWDGEGSAEGILWGGCVESLVVQATADKFLPSDDDMDGVILFLETSEDIPDHWIIEYLLTGFGERGWLDKFQAVLVGRPKAWEFNKQNSATQKAAYRDRQRQTVLRAVRGYNRTIPVIQNVDFGHTAPQLILPSGGKARISSSDRKIYLTY